MSSASIASTTSTSPTPSSISSSSSAARRQRAVRRRSEKGREADRAGEAGGGVGGNTKSEARNSKQIRSRKIGKFETCGTTVWDFPAFEFQICFGFRISCFGFAFLEIRGFVRSTHLLGAPRSAAVEAIFYFGALRGILGRAVPL